MTALTIGVWIGVFLVIGLLVRAVVGDSPLTRSRKEE